MLKLRRCLAILGSSALGLMMALTVFAGTASAHAKVIDSNPKMGSTIATAPTTITVTTAENINPDPKMSNLFVYSPAGDLISQGDAKVPLNNPKEMSIDIKPTGDGIYVVRWITVSADDNEADQGAFVFTVKAGATAATPTPAPTKTAPATPPQSTDTGFPVMPVAVSGLIALLVGLGAGFGLGRRGAGAGASVSANSEPATKREETPTK